MKAVKQSELSKDVKKKKAKAAPKLLKASETKKLGKAAEVKKLPKPNAKKIGKEEHKLLGVSPALAKKLKHSFKVKDPENALLLILKDGNVLIEMHPDVAPNHVARLKELVRAEFYNGLKFHRVINGFMAQTGCPHGTGTGGSGKKLKAEFSRNHHKRGTISMARAMDPNSADSQFFICFADCSWLDGQYTIWGDVIEGMELIDQIKKGDGPNGTVSNPDEIIAIKVISDL